ncbi:polysaccharide lyase family 7 protein [Vibrio rumoiensis]|uniref:Cyclic nucleotide-binding protein n=1 Tax=Vibrio rumoiensis 1S-45 TaxID=1188252 RepID=A0A1E5E2A3_9VIBR|nr:polysaccharide lyase family 7 protein [Vibrio rumoiensis]OEF25562.1 cyclic nucleotide-binding protein [Vibrio rumoiensis 1S-45]
MKINHTKTKLSVAILAICGISLAQAATVNNSSFESGWDGWNDSDPSSLSSVAYTGNQSAKLSGSSGKIEQTITIEKNATYELSAYVKGAGTIGVTGSGISQTKNTSASDWEKVTLTFNSSDANSVTIYGAYFSGEGRFDDFTLTKVSEGSSEPTDPGTGTAVQCSGNSALTVIAATDDGSHDGHGPSNAIDNNYGAESRWSSNGQGKAIIFNLGVVANVKEMSVAWYNGNSRNSYFDIETSANGTDWNNVYSGGVSSGSNSGLETYDIADSDAQYVKVIGQGNSVNTWNSMVEAVIKGCSDGSTPTIPTPPTDGLDPDVAPSGNFELIDWTLGVPIDEDDNGKSDTIKEVELSSGYELFPYFYTGSDGGMVFRSYVSGPKTSTGTSYTRSELREMLRRGDDSIGTQGVNDNNWVFSSAPSSDLSDAGGIDGVLEATLAVNHVTTTGDSGQIGRVIVGQIHANDDEPVRIYYRKLPNNSKGSIYFAHEPRTGSEQYYELIGSRSSSASNPSDGIALDEKFSYKIQVTGNTLFVTISREGKADITEEVNMGSSGYDEGGQYMYFKAGVYNQNNTGDSDDYAQATFYSLSNKHTGYSH